MPYIVSVSPSDGYRVNGKVSCATPDAIASAPKQASAGGAAWAELAVEERVRLLRPLVQMIRSASMELARLITLEMGKPIREARDEVATTIGEVEYLLDAGLNALQDVVISDDDVRKDILRREPWGVAAVVAPWNYPLEISLWGIIPNLVCGNAVLYKPSELVPLLASRLDSMFRDLDLGAGVFQTVFGRAKESAQLLKCDEVDLIWFTGSTAVGQKVYALAGKRFVKGVMELGGSSPALVFDDVAVTDELVRYLVGGRFTNCGQICSATKRLLVHRSVYSRLLESVVERVKQLRIGDPFDETTDISSLSSQKQLQLVEAQLEDAVKRRARIECGGKRWRGRDGAFLVPTVVSGVSPSMRILREEVFGPVLPIIPFETDEEAIRSANDTPFGLSAEVYSADTARAMAVARKIRAGRITINSPRLPGIACPFGGYKKSGMGREHGKWGFFELSQLKHIMVKKDPGARTTGKPPKETAK